MKQVLFQIGKHSSIYLIAQVVSNGLSFIMLPIYVNYFTPADFGCMALIDLASGLIFAVLVQGTLSALNRHHFEAETREEEQTVWWTGYLLVASAITFGTVLFFLLADRIAPILLGPEITKGPVWIRLSAVMLWMDTQNALVLEYLRAHKRSTDIVLLSIGRSLVFVALATVGIIILKLGPTAMFSSNLIASGTLLAVFYAVIARNWGRPRISQAVMAELWNYGWPLIFIGLLLTGMHQVNRWFVKELLTMDQVGLLSLGLTVADKVNRLIVLPFQQIWGMLVFELHAEHPERAVRTYCFVFEVFSYVLISVFLGCSVAAGPALTMIARHEFLGSVPLMPILCLAQFCLAVSDQFQAPIRIAKRTYLSIPAAFTGVLVACLANWWLIPRLGMSGAAWATLATYVSFSGVNLMIARQIEVYRYPFRRIGLILAGVCGTFLAYRNLEFRLDSMWLSLGVGLSLWAAWTGVMAVYAYRQFHISTLELPADDISAAGINPPLKEILN